MEYFEITEEGELKNKPNVTFPPKLNELYLSYNNLTDISNVNFPPELKILDLRGNNLSDISNVNFPSKLQELYLKGNNLSNISNVNFPSKLQVLDLRGNNLSDIFSISPQMFCIKYINVCKKIRIIQRQVRKWYWKRKRKENEISLFTFNIAYDMDYVHSFMVKKCIKSFYNKTSQEKLVFCREHPEA